jgi:hypothetical protein
MLRAIFNCCVMVDLTIEIEPGAVRFQRRERERNPTRGVVVEDGCVSTFPKFRRGPSKWGHE